MKRSRRSWLWRVPIDQEVDEDSGIRRLAMIWERTPAAPRSPMSLPNFTDMSRQNRSFSALAWVGTGQAAVRS